MTVEQDEHAAARLDVPRERVAVPAGADVPRLERTGLAVGREPDGGSGPAGTGRPAAPPVRPADRLRVDARRNLESVLKAAREVFAELGYGAPMEEVARRAGVGVGTVYRRFPSKEVLVQRIAAEEVGWLTRQARAALAEDEEPWRALAGFVARAVFTGAGRLLPPETFRRADALSYGAGPWDGLGLPEPLRDASATRDAAPGADGDGGDADPAALLRLVAVLVERAAAAGELRPGVTVSDVVLVLTASGPSYPAGPGYGNGTGTGPGADGHRVGRAGGRLLRILLDGLRAVPGGK